MTRDEILQAAEKIVCSDREAQYGSPENNFRLISNLWELYLKSKCVYPSGVVVCISPEDVACMMALLKMARIATGKYKADSYIDACGYMACAGELGERGPKED